MRYYAGRGENVRKSVGARQKWGESAQSLADRIDGHAPRKALDAPMFAGRGVRAGFLDTDEAGKGVRRGKAGERRNGAFSGKEGTGNGSAAHVLHIIPKLDPASCSSRRLG